MKLLIIPDIHTKVEKANQIIARWPEVDKVILLGDYVDEFHDSPWVMGETLLAVGEWQKDPKIVLLLGNHEASYIAPEARCSGWEIGKKLVWDQAVLSGHFDPKKFQAAYQPTQDILFTHAGFYTGEHFQDQISAVTALIESKKWATKIDYNKADGGRNLGESILCGRYLRAVPDPAYFQVFGHTMRQKPAIRDRFICLDTGLQHYMTMNVDQETGKFDYEIHEY